MAYSKLDRSLAAKVIAGVLLIVAVVSVVGLLVVEGVAALAEPLLFLYICAVVAYGVFTGRLDHPRVQAAFGVGVVAYGGYVYLRTGGLLWLAVAGVGVFLAIRSRSTTARE